MGTVSQLLNLRPFFLFHPPPNQTPLSSPPSSLSLKPPAFRQPSTKSTHVPALSPVNSVRVPRGARKEAQRVLLDYLHSTRSYCFLDAEFISKNSPRFLNSLLSKINKNDDVSRSLTKFLRYNPINEFEPFFESLGINQSELLKVLPNGMIFLSDDPLLIENFHALCNHGFPRNRLGKIYKEAREIFGYESGVLSSKFRGYEDLGLSKSSVIKLVVCCPLLLVGDVDSEFVVVLDWLERIGIEKDWIVDYMSSSRSYSWKRMIEVIEFVHRVGYSEKQMHDLFKADPKLLLEGFSKKLYLVLARAVKSGVEVNVICSYFIEHTYIMSNRCAENLLCVISFLYNIRMGEDDIGRILSNYMHLLSKNSIKGFKTVCKELGVGKADLCQIIKDDPLELVSLASKPKQKSAPFYADPRNYLEKTTFLLKLGYTENSEEMTKALNMFRGRGDQLQERFDCLVEAGLDYNSAIGMIKRVPMILNLKRTVIQKKIDFVKSNLRFPVECLVRYPTYFCHDLDKIIARFSMYMWLKDRNAINPMLSLSSIVSASDKRFVKYFVNMHPEGPAAWESIKRLSNKYKN